MQAQIFVHLKTQDGFGNTIENSELRILRGKATVRIFCELFLNTLQKQEFSEHEILVEMKDFFISHSFSPDQK